MSGLARALEEAASAALGRPVGPLRLEPLAGGCINRAARVELAGRACFVKWNDHDLPGQFAVEAAGLEALRASGTRLVVPGVVLARDAGPGRSFLVLELVPAGRPGPALDEALGRGLAELHRASDPRGFGFERDGYCGATPQPNGWLPTWADFYRQRRLLPQARLARSRGLDDGGLLDRLAARLDGLVGDPEPPALIHGDLWSGNQYADRDGRPVLVDPAAYYGHREAELGMMELFGGFSPRVYDAYHEAFPLGPGWRERVPLYSLYHVLNHWNLFGGGYGQQALRLARRYAA